MKFAFQILLLLSTGAVHGEDLGSKIEVLSMEGKAQMNVVMDPQDHLIYANFLVSGMELTQGQPVAMVKVRVWNSQTKQFMTEWESVKNFTPAYYTGQMGITWFKQQAPLADQIIQSLRSLQLEVKVNDNLPLRYLDLAAYCVSNASAFTNADTEGSGCP